MDGIQIRLKDGPFAGKSLTKTKGSFAEGSLIHFDGFSYRIEWDEGSWRWVGYVDNNLL